MCSTRSSASIRTRTNKKKKERRPKASLALRRPRPRPTFAGPAHIHSLDGIKVPDSSTSARLNNKKGEENWWTFPGSQRNPFHTSRMQHPPGHTNPPKGANDPNEPRTSRPWETDPPASAKQVRRLFGVAARHGQHWADGLTLWPAARHRQRETPGWPSQASQQIEPLT